MSSRASAGLGSYVSWKRLGLGKDSCVLSASCVPVCWGLSQKTQPARGEGCTRSVCKLLLCCGKSRKARSVAEYSPCFSLGDCTWRELKLGKRLAQHRAETSLGVLCSVLSQHLGVGFSFWVYLPHFKWLQAALKWSVPG